MDCQRQSPVAKSTSDKVYGYRKLHDDLLSQGECSSKNRGAGPASLAGISAQIGSKRCPGRFGDKPAVVAGNMLDRQLEVDAPDRVRVIDIVDMKTHGRWSYLVL